MTRYGKRLIAHAPERTTELLIDLCCGTLERAEEAATAETGAASYLSYLTKAAPTLAKSGSQNAAGAAAAPTVTSPDVATATNRRSGIVTTAFDVPNSVVAAPATTPDLPSPRRFFALFIDRPDLLVTFLETVAARRWGQELSVTPQLVTAAPLQAPSPAVERDQQAVWTTLLELYLGPIVSSEAKALQVLRQSERLPYDATQALLICTTASFVPGLMLLYERLGMQDDIVRFWMARADSGDDPQAMGEVMAALRQFGPDRPHLYPLVLRFLSSSAARVAAHQDDLLSVLDHVARERVMPPIAVVQCLARTEATSVGLVREYLKRQIVAEREEIDAVRGRHLMFGLIAQDRALIGSYRTETSKKSREIADLRNADAPRVFQVTRCSACGGQLELVRLRSGRQAHPRSRRCTSCASTRSTRAVSATTTPSVPTALARTVSSARSCGPTRSSRIATISSSRSACDAIGSALTRQGRGERGRMVDDQPGVQSRAHGPLASGASVAVACIVHSSRARACTGEVAIVDGAIRNEDDGDSRKWERRSRSDRDAQRQLRAALRLGFDNRARSDARDRLDRRAALVPFSEDEGVDERCEKGFELEDREAVAWSHQIDEDRAITPMQPLAPPMKDCRLE